MALALSGLEYHRFEVDLRDRPEQLYAVSAKGTVPVLVLPSGTVIDQSLEIMEWALMRNDPGDYLKPEIGDITSMKNLIAECDGDFKHHLDRYKYANRYPGAVADEHRLRASEFLQILEGRLAQTLFLFGERQSLADLAIAPFVRQFAGAGRAYFDAQNHPALQKWLNEFMHSNLFTSVMAK